MADVVVVGAGPAGSALALILARRGIDVTIVERAVFPRRKVCGEYLAAGAVDALERLGILESVKPLANALHGIRMISGATSAEIPITATSLAIERSRLDAVLFDAARAAGAKAVRGRVEQLIDEEGTIAGVRWRDEGGELHDERARFVAGADGAGSIVARKAGLTRPSRSGRFAVGGHYTGFDGLDGWVELYVGAGAYFAINPLDRERANVMVVVPQHALAAWSRDVEGGLRGKASELGSGHRSFAGTVRVGPRVSVGPLAHATRRATAPGVLLVGDAAGLLDPFTGQGVLLALTGAERAAAAIEAALVRRSHEGAAFDEYADALRSELRVRRRLCAAVSLLVNVAPLGRRAAARLRAVPHVGAAIFEAVSGLRAPRSALAFSTFGRLIV